MDKEKSISKKAVRGHYSEVQKKASAKYKAKAIRNVVFSMSKIYDADLLEVYDSIPNKAMWFKECLREYQKKHL